MTTPEEHLEALMVEAVLAEDVREKLCDPEVRERLEAAGYELAADAWGDPTLARAPYEDVYKRVEEAVAVLDLIGDENARALDALCRFKNRRAALDLRAQILEEKGARRGG